MVQYTIYVIIPGGGLNENIVVALPSSEYSSGLPSSEYCSGLPPSIVSPLFIDYRIVIVQYSRGFRLVVASKVGDCN